MKFNLKEKAKKALTYVALVALALNASFLVEMVPEAKAVSLNASITSFRLVDPVTNSLLGEIENNGFLNLADLTDPTQLNIVAEIGGPDENIVESVYFTGVATKNENVAPYALFGDNAPDYLSGTIAVGGPYTLTATPWSADNHTGISGESLTINFTVINNNEPTAPTLNTPADNAYLGSGNVTLDWNASTDADNDPISYGVNIENVDTSVGNTYVNAGTTINFPNLADGNYAWKVRSYDGLEYSDWSEIRTFTVDTVDPVVTIHTPVAGYVKGDVSIKASIVDSNLSHYYLKIVDSSNNIVYESSGGKVVSSEFTVQEILLWNTSLETEGKYTISLEARDLALNKDGNSSTPGVSYKEVEVTVDNTAPNPTYDSYVDATNPTNNNSPEVYGKFDNGITTSSIFGTPPATPNYDIKNINVKFDNGVDVYSNTATLDYLTGQYSTELSGDFTVMGVPVTSAFIPDGTYAVTACAMDEAGNYATEVIETALKIDTSAPAGPTNLQVIQKTPTSMKLKWVASAAVDVAGYQVSYGTKAGVFTQTLDVGNVNEYTVSGLSPSTKYYFKVTAYDSAMNGSIDSNEVSDTTTQEPIVASAGPQDSIDRMCALYEKRRDLVLETLNRLGLKAEKAKGTIYVWAEIPKGTTSAEFAEKVLQEAHVIVAPGTAYGPDGEGYIRISLTTPDDKLTEALERIKKVL